MEQDERLAIQSVLRGNRDSYRMLMERHYPVTYRIAFRITGNAKETAQDAFLRAYRKLYTFRQDSNFSTWVNRIAVNSALNIIERRSRDVGHAAERLDAPPALSTRHLQIADGKAGPERLLLNAS